MTSARDSKTRAMNVNVPKNQSSSHDVDLDGKKIDISEARERANTLADTLRAMENARKERYNIVSAPKARPVAASSRAALELQQETDNGVLSQEQYAEYDKPSADIKDQKTLSQKTQKLVSLPKLYSGKDLDENSDSIIFLAPNVVRSLVFEYAGYDIGPASNYNVGIRFSFFNQSDLPVVSLLKHILRGEKNEVDSLLQKNPALVLYKAQVINEFKQLVEGTAYQLAIDVDDASAVTNQEEGIATVVHGHFEKAFHDDKKAASEEIQKQTLLWYAVRGKKDEVKAILDQNPSLVLYKGQVMDYSGRIIEGTAYQIALGAEDINRAVLDEDNKPVLDLKGNIQLLHPDEGMAEMIRGYFIKAFKQDEKAANEEIQKQQEEQFPGGYEAYENSPEVKQEKANDIKALREVIDAIEKATVTFANTTYSASKGEVKVDANCQAALDKFIEHLRPKGILRHGKHFNVELLAEAFKSYDDAKRFNDFGGRWDSPKNVLMWRKVVGYIQRYLPANYAQAFCQGLYYIVDDNEKLTRSLKFRFERTMSFFPLDSDRASRLGFDFAGGGGAQGGALAAGGREASPRLQNLCRAKAAVFQIAYAAIPRTPEESLHDNVMRSNNP
jgi:hypothetical protein